METILKFRPAWYVFDDGTIGIFMLDGNRYAIGSGGSINELTAIDYEKDLSRIAKAIKLGTIDDLPTIDDAIDHAKKVALNIAKLLENERMTEVNEILLEADRGDE